MHKTILFIGFSFFFSQCQPFEEEHLELHPFLQTSDKTPIYSTRPQLRFAIIGDFGFAGNPAYQVSQMVKSWQPDFIITTGDNNYHTGELESLPANVGQYYGDFIYNPDAPAGYVCTGEAASLKLNRFFPSLGNHDYAGVSGNVPYLSYFALPGNEHYYDFIWGGVHCFALNTGQWGLIDSTQWAWLQSKAMASSCPHKVVYFHHSPYSTTYHGSAAGTQKDFASLGISAVITGHSHSYERIIPHQKPSPVYFVNGLGGRNLYDCGVTSLPNGGVDFNYSCYDAQYGAMLVQVDGERIAYEFYTIDDWHKPIDRYEVAERKTIGKLD